MLIPSLMAIALTPPALVAAPNPWPIEGHVGMLGAPPFALPALGTNPAWYVGGEAELGPRDGFWSVGGAAWTSLQPAGGQDTATTWYGRLIHRAGPRQSWSLMAGWSSRDQGARCYGTCFGTSVEGVLLGASWAYTADAFWVRVSPQYVFTGSAQPGYDALTRSAIPLAEAGLRLTPHMGLALRFATVPLKVEWRF